MEKDDDDERIQRLKLVCAVGPGSAADACGVTNKGECESIKPSNGRCGSRLTVIDGL